MSGGRNNTFVGSNIPESWGNGSGNTAITDTSVLNQHGSLAIGTGAKAGANSISIGANAGAGAFVDENQVAQEIIRNLQEILDPSKGAPAEIQMAAIKMMAELALPNRDKGLLSNLWSKVSAVATLEGATGFVVRVSALLSDMGVAA
jgi:hypothetical protein